MVRKLRKLLLSYIPIIVKTWFLRKIPSLYPFIEIKPSSCTILVTNRCNLRCLMCGQWRKDPGEDISLKSWKYIISDLKKNGIKNVHFSGGEPLLYRDFSELIKYCSMNDIVTGMTTNGTLLTRDILNKLLDSGLRSVVLSIDALDEEYDKIRGVKNLFHRVKEAGLLISEAKRIRDIDASINFTLMKDTIKTFEDVKKFTDSMELPISVCLLDRVSSIFKVEENKYNYWIGSQNNFADLDNLLDSLSEYKKRDPGSLLINFQGIQYIKKYFIDPLQKDIPCVISQDRLIIDPSGNLLGGCMSMGIFGNVLRDNIGSLLRSDRYRRAKRNMFYKNCPGCSCGYMFNIRAIAGFFAEDLRSKFTR